MTTNEKKIDPIAAAQAQADTSKRGALEARRQIVQALAQGDSVSPDEINECLRRLGSNHDELRDLVNTEKRDVELETLIAGEADHREAVRAASAAFNETEATAKAQIETLQAGVKAAYATYTGLVGKSQQYADAKNELSRLKRA